MNVAVFGSAFNPPTLGHADAITSVLNHETLFDKVLLIPSYAHAFSKTMLDYSLRVSMLERFVADLNQPSLEILAIEDELAKVKTPIYTYDLLEHLQNHYFPQGQISFVIGPDNEKNWHKFYMAQEIRERWSLLVVPENKQIRSTLVRQRRQTGEAIDDLVTPGVKQFIEENNLYV